MQYVEDLKPFDKSMFIISVSFTIHNCKRTLQTATAEDIVSYCAAAVLCMYLTLKEKSLFSSQCVHTAKLL